MAEVEEKREKREETRRKRTEEKGKERAKKKDDDKSKKDSRKIWNLGWRRENSKVREESKEVGTRKIS